MFLIECFTLNKRIRVVHENVKQSGRKSLNRQKKKTFPLYFIEIYYILTNLRYIKSNRFIVIMSYIEARRSSRPISTLFSTNDIVLKKSQSLNCFTIYLKFTVAFVRWSVVGNEMLILYKYIGLQDLATIPRFSSESCHKLGGLFVLSFVCCLSQQLLNLPTFQPANQFKIIGWNSNRCYIYRRQLGRQGGRQFDFAYF